MVQSRSPSRIAIAYSPETYFFESAILCTYEIRAAVGLYIVRFYSKVEKPFSVTFCYNIREGS